MTGLRWERNELRDGRGVLLAVVSHAGGLWTAHEIVGCDAEGRRVRGRVLGKSNVAHEARRLGRERIERMAAS